MEVLKKIYTQNNREIKLIAHAGQKAPEGSKTILLIGVVHGDEPQGKFLIENYLESARNPEKNKLLFIPCLNPDGYAQKTRTNASGVDLNRNFSTKNWEKTEQNEFFGGEAPSSEIETRFVEQIIEEYSPEVILTLHAPFKVVNFDGPAEEIATAISKIIDYPVQKDIGYPTPGSFGTYAGCERKISTITLELDELVDEKTLIGPMNKIFDYLAKI